MKNLLFLLLLPLLFGSCNIDMVQMGHPPKMSDHAYVKLKDGTMIPANNVKAVKKKLKTDSATYRKKNVAEYSNGGKIYTSVCGMLIPQMFSGDINGYADSVQPSGPQYVLPSPGGPGHWERGTQGGLKVYIQKEGTSKFSPIKYRHLKSMIPNNSPGYPYMHTYRNKTIWNNVIMTGGFGMFVGGALMYMNSQATSTGRGATSGAAIWIASPVFIVTGFFGQAKNHSNLFRAIAKHNGLDVK